jgi:general secretion pathway protein H
MSRAGKGERGFSLVELLAVMLLLGLANMIAVPYLDKSLKRREVKQSALELAAVARELRRRAIYAGSPQLLVFNPQGNSYQTSQRETVYLPQTVRIAAISGGEPLGGRLRQFLFFPNGSILGGEIEIRGHEGSTYLIHIEPLLGRVVVVRQ